MLHQTLILLEPLYSQILNDQLLLAFIERRRSLLIVFEIDFIKQKLCYFVGDVTVCLQNYVQLWHGYSLVFDEKYETLIVVEWIAPQFDFLLVSNLLSNILQIIRIFM